jgi:hypothetical protein
MGAVDGLGVAVMAMAGVGGGVLTWEAGVGTGAGLAVATITGGSAVATASGLLLGARVVAGLEALEGEAGFAAIDVDFEAGAVSKGF